MPDLMAWIDAVLCRPGLAWMAAVCVVALFLSGIVGLSGWVFGRLSDAWWRHRHPPVRAPGLKAKP